MSGTSIRRPVDSPAPPKPESGRNARRGDAFGALASAVVVATCLAIIVSWQAGAVPDLFLVFAAAGLLLRPPTAILLWAGLTLLVIAAGTLPLGNALLTERLGNLLYYDLTVACLWALWHMLAAQLGWRLPLQSLLPARQAAAVPAGQPADDGAAHG